ncbi:hypothetical protein PFISCL1PPCAC_15762, partial [Pristionchus fissidentatus]
HFDQTNNRTVYRYFWKPSDTESETVVPNMIDMNDDSLIDSTIVETNQNNNNEERKEEVPVDHFTTDPPTTPLTPPSPPPSPSTSRPFFGPIQQVPEFASPLRQPKIIPNQRVQQRPQSQKEEIEESHSTSPPQEDKQQGFRTFSGSPVFGPLPSSPLPPSSPSSPPLPQFPPDFDVFPQFGIDEKPLEPWAPTEKPKGTESTRRESTTTSTTTERPTSTEETTVEIPQISEFPNFVEDISQFNDEFSEHSLDERELVSILNKEESQREVTEAKWFSGAANSDSFDKEESHLSGSPKRFIPQFPGEVDASSFPETTEHSIDAIDEDELSASQTPKHIVFTTKPTVFTRPPSTLSSESPLTTETTTIMQIPEFTTIENIEESNDEPEKEKEFFGDEVLEETAVELSQAFEDFERLISTEPTEGTTEPTSTTTAATTTTTQLQEQIRPALRQGVRPTVIVWGRRPPKQPVTMVEHIREISVTTSKPKRGKKKTTKVPLEVSILDELIGGSTSLLPITTSSPLVESHWLQKELAHEAKIGHLFNEPSGRTTLAEIPHAAARIRGRSGGRKIRGKGNKRREVDTSKFIVGALNRDDHPSPSESLPSKASLPHFSSLSSPHLLPSPAPLDSIQLLVHDLQRELATKGFDEQSISSCSSINCDFEKGDLCHYESSLDELIFGDDSFRRRRKRSSLNSLPISTVRAWTNWGGAKGDPKLGMIGIASPRLTPSDVFSQGKNERFAGTQVNSNQMAMMSTQINAKEPLRILFDAWEGTRGVQLRVCCDSLCPFETELGVKKGHRNWLQREVTCPAGTRQLSFECTNSGRFRGACGVDNVRMEKC